uniref:Uncharacterized protein n=1 Tax=Oryza sativa subsp. japonica TaxID=39947 RepID=Q6YYI7_ORYSJ|nr:hypothetical protein [Oryza sativa Japonica Group]
MALHCHCNPPCRHPLKVSNMTASGFRCARCRSRSFINIGDILEVLTNENYRSREHWVKLVLQLRPSPEVLPVCTQPPLLPPPLPLAIVAVLVVAVVAPPPLPSSSPSVRRRRSWSSSSRYRSWSPSSSSSLVVAPRPLPASAVTIRRRRHAASTNSRRSAASASSHCASSRAISGGGGDAPYFIDQVHAG